MHICGVNLRRERFFGKDYILLWALDYALADLVLTFDKSSYNQGKLTLPSIHFRRISAIYQQNLQRGYALLLVLNKWRKSSAR